MSSKEATLKGQACTVKSIYKGQMVTDGAGVRIHRIIGSSRLSAIDPFVLLDEIRSNDPGEYAAGFPMHPHRGIETITYMKRGGFRHRDSRGGGGLLTGGSVQWMTAGRGILHSEMPEQAGGELWGYQLWLSLPAKDKMVEPRYQHLSPDMIPVVEKHGAAVTVISGAYDGVRGPAKNRLEADYFDVELKKDAVFHFKPDGKMNCFLYVHTGNVCICPKGESRTVGERELAHLTPGTEVEITGTPHESGFLFLAAYPNNEPIVRGGPFVMNTEEEIEQAFYDYRNGRIG
ncbi:MAG: pirin family protein [Terriglobia bacterium]